MFYRREVPTSRPHEFLRFALSALLDRQASSNMHARYWLRVPKSTKEHDNGNIQATENYGLSPTF
jgi:hypothetical protein